MSPFLAMGNTTSLIELGEKQTNRWNAWVIPVAGKKPVVITSLSHTFHFQLFKCVEKKK
jgi:hypothetical protein